MDLPEEVRDRVATGAATHAPGPLPHAPAVERPPRGPDPEKERIVMALEAHHWNRQKAAAALGLSRSTLWRRMRALGIE